MYRDGRLSNWKAERSCKCGLSEAKHQGPSASMTIAAKSQGCFKFIPKVAADYKRAGADSDLEARMIAEARAMMDGGDIENFQTHVTERIVVNGQHVGDINIDLKIWHKDGRIEWIDTKGIHNRDWQFRWNVFTAISADDEKKQFRILR